MLSIYEPGGGQLHRLHPRTKLAAASLIVVATYALPWTPAPLAVFVGLVALALYGGVARSVLGNVARILLPVLLSLLLIQGLLFPPRGATPLPLGPITLTREGPLFALVVSARLLALSTTVLLVLRTTHPADLVLALCECGLPRSISYTLLVALQIVPEMLARAGSILEVQRARGLETGRALLGMRALMPLIGPLVVGALLDVEERALALESRAYTSPGPKTSLRQLVDTRAQRAARWACMALALLLGLGWFARAFV